MIRTRKFVVPALVAALWVAVFGLVPLAASASPSNDDARHPWIQLDTSAAQPAALVAEDVCPSGLLENPFDGDGVNVDEDGPDDLCWEAPGAVAIAAPDSSIAERRDHPHLRSHRESLAARAPPRI